MNFLSLAFKIDLPKLPKPAYDEIVKIVKEYKFKEQFSNYHDGGWQAIGLITSGGNEFEDRELKHLKYQKTKLLLSMPALNNYLDSIDTLKKRVRIMKLEKMKKINTHSDSSETYDENQLRIHIPIITNEKVRVKILNQIFFWDVGEIWYGDFSFPHSVENMGNTERYHLVIDCKKNRFTDKLISPRYKKQKIIRSFLRIIFVTLFKIKQKINLK